PRVADVPIVAGDDRIERATAGEHTAAVLGDADLVAIDRERADVDLARRHVLELHRVLFAAARDHRLLRRRAAAQLVRERLVALPADVVERVLADPLADLAAPHVAHAGARVPDADHLAATGNAVGRDGEHEQAGATQHAEMVTRI